MPPISESDPTLSNGEKQKQLDNEIKEMVSALTSRLANLHSLQKSGRSSHQDEVEDDEHGVRIITLAGNNVGATMRGEMIETGSDDLSDHEPFLAYVNNNFQAINNSIMLGGEYTANDPGVHLDISDYTEDEAARPSREVKKGKRRGRGGSRNDHHAHAEHSDYADALTVQS